MTEKILPIWKLKDPVQTPVLRAVAEPIAIDAITTPEMSKLVRLMVKAMYAANGIGLAAPQIGRSIRLAVISPEVQNLPAPLVLFNPTITSPSTQQETMEEGCLSLPKVFGPVARAWALTVTALDQQGQPYTLRAEGLLARVIQHEVDHLNGKLFIDRADKITHGKNLL